MQRQAALKLTDDEKREFDTITWVGSNAAVKEVIWPRQIELIFISPDVACHARSYEGIVAIKDVGKLKRMEAYFV